MHFYLSNRHVYKNVVIFVNFCRHSKPLKMEGINTSTRYDRYGNWPADVSRPYESEIRSPAAIFNRFCRSRIQKSTKVLQKFTILQNMEREKHSQVVLTISFAYFLFAKILKIIFQPTVYLQLKISML